MKVTTLNDPTGVWRKRALLVEPTYGRGEPFRRRPTLREIRIEWLDAVGFWKDRGRLLPALYAAYHLATLAVFVVFFARHFSIAAVAVVTGIATMIGTVFNTVWYHRYCTHRAFKFRSLWLARLFLWTNPVCFREESYVIPHRIHHSKSDQPGDPYGPHLGWLGSYLATESQQKVNRDLSRAEFERLAKSLEHIGFVRGSYEQFQRLGSVENVWYYLARAMFASVFWMLLAYAVAKWQGILGWISGVFLYSFLVRDFNFRGHAGYWGTHHIGVPLNQVFYGLIAGEWHENHHAYPRSAKAGLAWWQIDVPYWIIKGLTRCGAVIQYNSPPEGKVRHSKLILPEAV